MDDDREALDWLYENAFRLYPPGPRRDFWSGQIKRMAAFTRCPDWRPKRQKSSLKLCSPPPAETR